MALTLKLVSNTKNPGRYGDGHGLYLQISDSGIKSWILRYQRQGVERWMGLGAIHTITLPEARERARRARQQILEGLDPLDVRKSDRAAQALEAARVLTFEQAAQQYFDQHAEKWRNAKHRAQFLSTLRAYAYPFIGKLSIAAIDTGQVLRCLEPIWKKKPETGNRVRGRIENVLDWASVRGFRTGDNPARWKSHLDNVLPARGQIQKVVHHAALPYVEIPLFVTELRQREGVAARALEFTILTAARTGETIGARWSEIDFTAKTWTVPAGRMKASKEHRVPLSERALEILRALPSEDGNDFVFIGARASGLSNMAMAAVLERMGKQQITVHGMRSSFRDWAAERTNFPNHVLEMALAHVVGPVERAYRRSNLFDKRAELMAAWSRYAGGEEAAGNVVEMREAV